MARQAKTSQYNVRTKKAPARSTKVSRRTSGATVRLRKKT